jgi:hypothetical protein
VPEVNSRAVCDEMSVVDPPGRDNFTAMPRTPGVLSACFGLPAPLENRTSAGTGSPVNCAALESDAAPALAVKVPTNSKPLACKAR